MPTTFPKVFETELEAVKARRTNVHASDPISPHAPPVDTDPNEAFPRLVLEKSPRISTPKDISDVYDEVNSKTQDKRWDEAVREAAQKSPNDDPPDMRTHTGHRGLIGLALSGGGIRSATYNLGIIQALERCGLWQHVDYLSTVSGGGYIGSCLSSLYTSPPPQPKNWFVEQLGTIATFVGNLFSKAPAEHEEKPSDIPEAPRETGIEFPFLHTQGKLEPETFRHLRNNANYIAPHGLLDYLRPLVVLLRGIVVNVLVVLPYILIASVATILLYPYLDSLQNGVGKYLPLSTGIFPLTSNLLLVLMIAFALYPLARAMSVIRGIWDLSTWKGRQRTEKTLAALIALVGTLAFIELQPLAINWLHKLLHYISQNWKGFLDTQTLSAWLGGVGTVIAALSATPLARARGSRWGQAGLYAIGFLGFALLWLLYLSLCRWAIHAGTAPEWLAEWGSATTSVISWALSPLSPPSGLAATPGLSKYGQLTSAYTAWAALLAAYSVWLFDLNSTSLHNFYRDRLSKAYLIRFDEEGNIELNDDQPLSKLNKACAPYHLINAAINVKNPTDAEDPTEEKKPADGKDAKQSFRRGRQADTFTFSADYIGGPLTQYCETKQIEDGWPHINLGTAMAISGAAFAATAGKATIRPLAFLLAMLNVRLNYWLPNPRRIGEDAWSFSKENTADKEDKDGLKRLVRGLFNKVGPWYLIRELFGLLNERSPYVDISDGGHFENLGVYELLRRECRLIIVGDGECDPNLKFEAVSELVRLAQIDLGIWIEIEGLDAIRAGRQHHAIGTIHYSGGRIGKMVYLKSSLLKDDNLEASLLTTEAYLTSSGRDDDRQYDSNPYIAHYKSKHPDFPHQTTADQFFDERQFECYRALGYMVGMRTWGRWPMPKHKTAGTIAEDHT